MKQDDLKTLYKIEDNYQGDDSGVIFLILRVELIKWIAYYNDLGRYFDKTNPIRASRHYAQAIAFEIFLDGCK